MLAKPAAAIPRGHFYEPKWDGFRSIVFRDGNEVEIGSRKERPMTRYFPEVVEAVRRSFPPRAVIDGDIVIAGDGGLDFWALQQRIHPAASRVARLAAETPASFIAFDLLALGDDDLTGEPFADRRAALERALASAADLAVGRRGRAGWQCPVAWKAALRTDREGHRPRCPGASDMSETT
jgi:ATP-dependent DNA ligase